MKKIAFGGCPYVVNMVGCCTTQEPLALVLEYLSQGDLLDYLRKHRKQVRKRGGDSLTPVTASHSGVALKCVQILSLIIYGITSLIPRPSQAISTDLNISDSLGTVLMGYHEVWLVSHTVPHPAAAVEGKKVNVTSCE